MQSVILWAKQYTTQQARQIRLGKCGKMVFAGKTKLTTLQIQHGENGAVFADKADKAKMGRCLGGGLLSLVARTFWHTKIFKRFVFGLLRPFYHFEPFAKRRKIQRIESALAILGYFANAQYDKVGQYDNFISIMGVWL